MAKELPRLSESQLEILEIVWELGSASVADVRDRLAAVRPVARNTVQTQLTRLEAKGWLTHEDHGAGVVYSATRPRSRVLAGMARRFVERAFGGAPDALVQSLLHGRGLLQDEADRIRALLDAHAAQGGGDA